MHKNSGEQKMLNLGCGNHYHTDWVNIDFISKDKNIRTHDLRLGIPYSDNTFNVVYHSHILEHFTKSDAEKFMKECYRVLKPAGIIRVAIPDLEVIARNYVAFLELAVSGDKTAEANYNWTLLEMYDQTVRNYSGGEMGTYLKQKDILNKDFIIKRIGHLTAMKKTADNDNNWKSYIRQIMPAGLIKVLKDIKNKFTKNEYKQLGKFRTSGEIHQWMYDRFSLKRLLENTGFVEIIQRSATESYIPDWPQYNLDSESDGTTYKPDSLFMEAKK